VTARTTITSIVEGLIFPGYNTHSMFEKPRPHVPIVFSSEYVQGVEDFLRKTHRVPFNDNKVDILAVRRILHVLQHPGKTRANFFLASQRGSICRGLGMYGPPSPKLTEHTRNNPDETMEVKLLLVDPEFRRKGIASKLLTLIERDVLALGKSKIQITCSNRFGTEEAQEFLVKMEYTPDGVIERYFDKIYSAKVHQKVLK
jgi:GNAT superfamily N-acetyltransferase